MLCWIPGLHPYCRFSFPWCYLCWSLGDDYRGYYGVSTRILSTEVRIEAPRRRALSDDMLVPSTITFHVVVFKTIWAYLRPVRTYRIILHLPIKLSPDIFEGPVMSVTCRSGHFMYVITDFEGVAFKYTYLFNLLWLNITQTHKKKIHTHTPTYSSIHTNIQTHTGPLICFLIQS